MIKEHPFTTLCEILRSGNDEVMNIFNQYAVRKNTPVQPPSRFRELILTTKPIMNKDDAKARIDGLVKEISNCGNNYFAVFQKMSEELTTDGIGKLLLLMGKDKIDEFLQGEDIQYLFKGMPIYKVVVKKYDRVHSGTDGWFDIYLKHTGTGEGIPVKFDTRPAKALYLLFLLMPRTEIKNFEQYKDAFEEMVNYAFDNKGTRQDDWFKEENYTELLKQAMSQSRRYIERALVNHDDPQWYIIDYDRKDSYYSLSLPEEMIELPEELITFRKNHVEKLINKF